MITFDKPIEVSKSQYRYLIKAFAGLIAHKKSKGKYYIKYWGPFGYGKKELAKYIGTNK